MVGYSTSGNWTNYYLFTIPLTLWCDMPSSQAADKETYNCCVWPCPFHKTCQYNRHIFLTLDFQCRLPTNMPFFNLTIIKTNHNMNKEHLS